MLSALIGSPSISCTDRRFDQSNLGVIHMLAEWLERIGFSIDIEPVSADKTNLIAVLGGLHNAQGLVLSGHTDTVPYDQAQWTVDPFRITEKDDRFYGLGTADMKAFFALVIEAAKHFRAKDLKHPLVVLATADEESTMSGAKALVRSGTKLGRYAVIGEPTGLRPVRMHKGIMMESIRVKGHAGHSSNPSLGANAVEGMMSVLTELLVWRGELQAKYRDPLFEVDVPTLNIGSIHGGDNPNRICAHCESQIDIRPLPGMNLEELRQSLNHRLQPVLAGNPRLSLEISPLFEGLPAFETPAEASIVRTCEDLCGTRAGAVAFGTEAPYLSQLGIQTVVLGPGSIDQAHQPDEYLPISHVKPTVDMLKKLIEHFCITHREGWST